MDAVQDFIPCTRGRRHTSLSDPEHCLVTIPSDLAGSAAEVHVLGPERNDDLTLPTGWVDRCTSWVLSGLS